MWHRVFAQNLAPLPPADLLEYLRNQGLPCTGHFRGDDDGWFHVALAHPETETAFEVQRYLSTEEGIRRDLNTWAAWVEHTLGEDRGAPWMRRLITVPQLFTLRRLEGQSEVPPPVERLLIVLCQYLAAVTEGFYQVDGRGFFSAEGVLLIPEIV